MNQSWYTNLLSAMLMILLTTLVGKGSAILDLIFGRAERVAPCRGRAKRTADVYMEVHYYCMCISTSGDLCGCSLAHHDRTRSVSLAGLLSIMVTSPITHMVSSAVRAASLLGMWLFGEVTVSRGACSAFFVSFFDFIVLCSQLPVCGDCASITILLGSVYYTAWVKHVEPRQPPKDADTYERVPLENIEITKESDTKPKPE